MPSFIRCTPGQARARSAHFGGKFNRTKSLCFLFPRNSEWAEQQKGILTIRQLHFLTGISIGSLSALLPRYTRWHYLARTKVELSTGRFVWGYSLGAKGHRYLERYRTKMPLEQWADEVEQARSALPRAGEIN